MYKKWTQYEDAYITSNHIIQTKEEISQFLQRTKGSCEYRIFALKLQKGHRKYKFNDNFFSDNTLESNYWAGMLAADGCVRKIGNHSYLSLSLKFSDKDHVEAFAKAIQYTGSVKKRTHKGYANSIITICCCPKIAGDLDEMYGIVPRKSLILKRPEISDFQKKLAFITGYVDGDGCIRIDEKGRLEFSVVGTYDMLTWVQETVDQLVPPQGRLRAKARLRKNRNYADYKITGYRACKILQYMLKLDVPKLNRKWKVVSDYVNKPSRLSAVTWANGFDYGIL